jgi:acyl-homoserine lactone acylase PvdQ
VLDRTQHALVPRTAAAALSVRSTADAPSFEIRALYQLARAGDVHAGFAALADIASGGQSWVLIDDHQHIGWTTQATIPLRARAAYGWDPLVRQDAAAPFFVLPGDGSGDWISGTALSPRYIPHAVDPASGSLVTANADPVGATLYGLPLAQAALDGQPLYAGVRYAAGLREDRITQLLTELLGAGKALTLDDMARIQTDTRSTVGERLVPAIRAALDRLDSPAGAPSDLAGYVAQLSPDDRARLATARALLGGWTLATPPATAAPDPDSAATALFNAWIHAFIARALGDELAAIGWSPWRLDDGQLVRIVHALLVDPRSMVTSPATQQPVVCADATAPGPDTSCTVQTLAALLDAMTYLASPDGFGTADTAAWRWGLRHRLAIAPVIPDRPAGPAGPDGPGAAYALPAPGDPDPAGFARPGDNFGIDRTDPGWADLGFAQRTGAGLRLLAEARPGRPIALRWAIPGGAVYDRRSPHYRDLLDHYYLTGQTAEAPYAIGDIVAAGESRWVFH